jgi:hypothetical protein
MKPNGNLTPAKIWRLVRVKQMKLQPGRPAIPRSEQEFLELIAAAPHLEKYFVTAQGRPAKSGIKRKPTWSEWRAKRWTDRIQVALTYLRRKEKSPDIAKRRGVEHQRINQILQDGMDYLIDSKHLIDVSGQSHSGGPHPPAHQ